MKKKEQRQQEAEDEKRWGKTINSIQKKSDKSYLSSLKHINKKERPPKLLKQLISATKVCKCHKKWRIQTLPKKLKTGQRDKISWKLNL